jgi:hypothetical protein
LTGLGLPTLTMNPAAATTPAQSPRRNIRLDFIQHLRLNTTVRCGIRIGTADSGFQIPYACQYTPGRHFLIPLASVLQRK